MVGNNDCNQSCTIFKINDIFIKIIFTKYLLYVSWYLSEKNKNPIYMVQFSGEGW